MAKDTTTYSTKCPRAFLTSSVMSFAERFSYWRNENPLLFYDAVHYESQRQKDLMNETDAIGWYHWFSTANYFSPIVGAFLSDIPLGKIQNNHQILSIVYCLGHLALALMTHSSLKYRAYFKLLSARGIKPRVSAHVGDQFHKRTNTFLEKSSSFIFH